MKTPLLLATPWHVCSYSLYDGSVILIVWVWDRKVLNVAVAFSTSTCAAFASWFKFVTFDSSNSVKKSAIAQPGGRFDLLAGLTSGPRLGAALSARFTWICDHNTVL